MFACRCSVPTEIMAKCISLHPEYYDYDSKQNDSEDEKEKEKGGGQIIEMSKDDVAEADKGEDQILEIESSSNVDEETK